MKRNIQRTVTVGLLLVSGLLLSWATLRVLTKRAELDQWVHHTREVQTQIARVQVEILQAETVEREYLLTAGTGEGQARQAAYQQIDHRIDELKRLTADNPVQQTNIQNLHARIALRREIVSQISRLFAQHLSLPSRRFLLSREKRQMQAVRQRLTAMEQEEARLFDRRSRTYNAFCSRINILFLSLPGIVLLSLGILFAVQRHHQKARRKSQKELEWTERQLQETTTVQNAILDGANYSIIATDVNGIIRSFNATAQCWLDYTAAEVIGKASPVLFHSPEEITHYAEELNQELGMSDRQDFEVLVARSRNSIVAEREWTYIRRDGSRFPVSLSVTVLRSRRGRVNGYLLIGSDLTGRKQAEMALQQNKERLKAVVDIAVDGIITIDSRGLIQTFNPAAEHIFGYIAAEVIGENVSMLMPEPYHSAHDGYLTHHLQTGEKKIIGIGREVAGRRKDRSTFPLELAVSSVCQNGEMLFVGLVRDITERHQAEIALKHSEALLAEAQAVAHIGSWEYDVATWETYWSEEMFPILDIVPAQEAPSYEGLLSRMHPDDLPMYEQCVREAIMHTTPYAIDVRILKADGSLRWAHTIGKSVCDDEGEVVRLVGTLMDITESKEAARQLQEANQHLQTLASTDGLTGLKNHRTFQEHIKGEYDRSQRYHSPLSLVLLDVDRFKQFNDTYGHPAGDGVLRQIAEVLRETARSTDIVARYGGEEFVIILPEADADQARQAAERFREAIEAFPWQERPMTASFGVATRHDGINGTDILFAEADAALYRSKQRGRNCVTHASDPIEPLTILTEPAQAYAVTLPPLRELKDHGLVLTLGSQSEPMVHAYDATIESWSRILDMRDKETEGHSIRVMQMTVCLARSLGLSAEDVLYARWGALLHDIGKMGVPDSILLKPSKLTESEWEIMRQHPTIAYEMLSPVAFLRPALDIPYCHHECFDGTGYPRHLHGAEIPLTARLFAVIDVYDALRSDRPYREAWDDEQVCAYLQEQSGTHFDPYMVEAFLKLLQEGNITQYNSSSPWAA